MTPAIDDQPKANKTDAGNGSKALCRVSNVLRSPSPDPRRSPKFNTQREKQMSGTAFFEIVFQSSEFDFAGRDEVEDPLDKALSEEAIGEVTGGGSGMGRSNIDVETVDSDSGLALIRQVLQRLQVPRSTIIRQRTPILADHPVYPLPSPK